MSFRRRTMRRSVNEKAMRLITSETKWPLPDVDGSQRRGGGGVEGVGGGGGDTRSGRFARKVHANLLCRNIIKYLHFNSPCRSH